MQISDEPWNYFRRRLSGEYGTICLPRFKEASRVNWEPCVIADGAIAVQVLFPIERDFPTRRTGFFNVDNDKI